MAATFTILIKIDPTRAAGGARTVEASLDRVHNKTLELNRALRNVFGVFAIKEAVVWIYKLADGYTVLQNKLRVVANDERNMQALTQQTFEIAQRTRTSWEATAQMYSRVALNSRELGASQERLLNFTELLNKAVIVSGATSTEAAAGLLQLSQGMASGTLRGDELRAVLEQLPYVADIIAKKLGITRGELRQFGKEGKITSKTVLEAMEASANEIDEKFGRTLPTLSQMFVSIQNAAMKFFGEAGTGSGVLRSLGTIVKFVVGNFETFGKILLATAEFIGVILAVRAIGRLIVAMRALAIAANTHPLLAIVTVITALILLLRQFGDQMESNVQVWSNVDGVFASVGDRLRALWDMFKELAGAIYDFLGSAWTDLVEAFSGGLDGTGIEFSLRNVMMFIASFVDAAIAIFRALGTTLFTIFTGIPKVVGELFVDLARNVALVFGEMINILLRGINIVTRALTGSINVMKIEDQYIEGKKKGLTGDALKDYASKGAFSDGIGAIPEVDFSFKNPLAGSADDAHKKLVDAWNRDTIMGQTGARDAVTRFNDDLDRRTRDHAAKRLTTQNPTGEIDKTGGPDITKPPEDKAAKTARNRLGNELEGLMKRSNPVTKAQMQLTEAGDILTRSVQQRIVTVEGEVLTWERAGQVLQDYVKELEAALHPFETQIKEIEKETAAMTGSTEEHAHKIEMLKLEHDLLEKGITLSEYQRAQLDSLIKKQEERARVWKIEQDIYKDITEPMRIYTDTLKAIISLEEQGRITTKQAGEERRKATETWMKTNDEAYARYRKQWAKDNPLMEGWNEGISKIETDMLDVATKVSDVLTKAFGNLESFIIDTAESGKLAWDSLIDGLISSLNRLAVKILETWLLKEALGIGIGGAAAAAYGGSNYIQYGGAHADGGDYVVPGVGPPDSRRVMFDLTPGERVTFTPPGRGSAGSAPASSQPQKREELHIHNHHDGPGELNATISSPTGKRHLMNFIRSNSKQIRSIIDIG